MRVVTSRISIALCAFVVGVVAASFGKVSSPPVIPQVSSARLDVAQPAPPPRPAETKSEPAQPDEEWNPPESPPHAARLLEVGEYHNDEVTAKTGEHWLGLYVTGSGSLLSDSVLKVTAVRDEIVDNNPQAKTGKRVSVVGRSRPVLLVKGPRSLRPGPARTVFVGNANLVNSTRIGLTLGTTNYGLYVKTKDTSYASSISLNDAQLILTKNDGDTEQVIYDLGRKGGPIEGYWELLWAGDMDGDERLDLYVQVGHHYNVTVRKLFLSSRAKKGGLVREVAELVTVGC